MSTKERISSNLRLLRSLRRMSQLDLADKVGLSRRTIARLEAGDIADPGVDQIRAIAEALGVSLSLLSEEDLAEVRIAVPVRVKDKLESPDSARTLDSIRRLSI